MMGISGGKVESCGHYTKCAANVFGKRTCIDYSNCGIFSKNACDTKYWANPTL